MIWRRIVGGAMYLGGFLGVAWAFGGAEAMLAVIAFFGGVAWLATAIWLIVS